MYILYPYGFRQSSCLGHTTNDFQDLRGGLNC